MHAGLKEGSGTVLGRFWDDFQRVLDGFWEDFGQKFGSFLEELEGQTMIRATKGKSMDGWMDGWIDLSIDSVDQSIRPSSTVEQSERSDR